MWPAGGLVSAATSRLAAPCPEALAGAALLYCELGTGCWHPRPSCAPRHRLRRCDTGSVERVGRHERDRCTRSPPARVHPSGWGGSELACLPPRSVMGGELVAPQRFVSAANVEGGRSGRPIVGIGGTFDRDPILAGIGELLQQWRGVRGVPIELCRLDDGLKDAARCPIPDDGAMARANHRSVRLGTSRYVPGFIVNPAPEPSITNCSRTPHSWLPCGWSGSRSTILPGDGAILVCKVIWGW